MANTFQFPEVFSAEYQRTFYKQSVAMDIADSKPVENMSYGDVFYRTKIDQKTDGAGYNAYVRGTDISVRDLTDANEGLTVNSQFASGFYVDKFDKIQDNKDAAAKYGEHEAINLKNQIDADVLGETANATSIVDDGTIGGTAGNGITVTQSNVISVLAAAARKLDKQNIDDSNRFAVLSPDVYHELVEARAGRDTVYGDEGFTNGKTGMNIYGFEIYKSNNLRASAVLSLATNPTDGDTVTIAGQVFTFVDTIGTTAGNVHIEATVDGTRANLATLINTPGTTTAGGVALTGDALEQFQNRVSATNNDAADTLTVVYKGPAGSVLEVSSDLTDGTDTWTATAQLQHLMFGQRGTPSLIVQSMPEVEVRAEPKQLGKNFLYGTLYGFKTYSDNAKMMVDVRVRTDAL